jgi:4-hydroxy-tetrahydrodipicolinate synthase
MDTDYYRQQVSGPVVSIKTPFTREGEIDYTGLRQFLDFAIDGGTTAILFTPGDSLYMALTDDDVAELTRVTAEHIGDRALFIASGDFWWTGKTVEFGEYARSVGADAFIAVPPIRGTTVDELVSFYTAASQTLPVFILSGSLGAAGVAAALEAVKILLDTAPGVVGFKEDFSSAFARPACLAAHDRWAIFAGGQKQTHMDMHPYGCDGYMSIYMTYRPEIAHSYWRAIERGDLTAAAHVIRDYDMPLVNHLYSAYPAGGDAAQHAMLEMEGICGRWRRKPLPDLTDADMETLKAFLASLPLP